MKKHWSEVLSCQCGKRFRSYAAEAFHRNNFPILCKRKKETKRHGLQTKAHQDDGRRSDR